MECHHRTLLLELHHVWDRGFVVELCFEGFFTPGLLPAGRAGKYLEVIIARVTARYGSPISSSSLTLGLGSRRPGSTICDGSTLMQGRRSEPVLKGEV